MKQKLDLNKIGKVNPLCHPINQTEWRKNVITPKSACKRDFKHIRVKNGWWAIVDSNH